MTQAYILPGYIASKLRGWDKNKWFSLKCYANNWVRKVLTQRKTFRISVTIISLFLRVCTCRKDRRFVSLFSIYGDSVENVILRKSECVSILTPSYYSISQGRFYYNDKNKIVIMFIILCNMERWSIMGMKGALRGLDKSGKPYHNPNRGQSIQKKIRILQESNAGS